MQYAPPEPQRRNGYTNGYANGYANGHTSSRFTNGYAGEAPPPQLREKPPTTNATAAAAPPVAAAVPPTVIAAPMTTNTVPQYLWEKDPEIDDALHNPDARRDYFDFTLFSGRGWVNLTALVILVCGLLMLFLGYPMYYEFGHPQVSYSGYNLVCGALALACRHLV